MTPALYWLTGTWFIISSNFPMWLKGDKTHPTFTYTLVGQGEQQKLLDVVRYSKNGKIRKITGYDNLQDEEKMTFVWRGKGWLFFAESNWQIRLVDPDKKWAVIWFSKTLFTPEGVDIISRSNALTDAELAHIKSLMQQDEILKKHTETLHTLTRSD